MKVAAYASHAPEDTMNPFEIERRAPGTNDVSIRITHCGVCHSDIHQAHNDWHNTRYPVVPGHEIVGIVEAVGADVTRFAVGDRVGVGCLVDACTACPACYDGDEMYCERGSVGTYNGKDAHLGGHTFGGYSQRVVVRDHFVLKIPTNLDPAGAAPLLCAGITSWSPLKHWNIGKGDKVAVVGLGGLGHMGIKFAVALGAEVTMVTTSANKGEDAQRLGAHHVLLSTDRDAMKAHTGAFDFILNTIPVKHDMMPYLRVLKRNGTMVIVGAIEPIELHIGGLISGRKRLAASAIGGIAETQEMLDFCGEHNIVSDYEMTSIQDINQAWTRVQSGDVKYRFVIDIASLDA